MKPRPAYIAALPREVAPLVKGWQFDAALAVRDISLYWNDSVIVACAGMGAHRVALAVEAALSLGPIASLTSIGWAGACDPSLRVGSVIEASTVIDARTGERFACAPSLRAPSFRLPSGERVGSPDTGFTLVTTASPASVNEKARLASAYSASLVDMEAATVARLAEVYRVPFTAIKAISDEADIELVNVERFVTATGQIREFAFGLYVAMRPSRWPSVIRLARTSKRAAVNLSAEIKSKIEIAQENSTDNGR